VGRVHIVTMDFSLVDILDNSLVLAFNLSRALHLSFAKTSPNKFVLDIFTLREKQNESSERILW
jgi:hypothetical protein